MSQNESGNSVTTWGASATATALANSSHFENALSSSTSLSSSQLNSFKNGVSTASNYNAING